jgi:hypothetical protein
MGASARVSSAAARPGRDPRRLYGAPGTIIQTIRKAGARDCVMLDEIDKMGTASGDPASAMLDSRSRAEQHLHDNHPCAVRLSRVVPSPPPTCSTPSPAAARRMEIHLRHRLPRAKAQGQASRAPPAGGQRAEAEQVEIEDALRRIEG